MKAKFVLIPAVVLFFGISVNPSFAQDSSAVKSLPPITITSITKKIPPIVWFNLSRYFPEAENPRWYALNKDYLAKFMIYTQENRVLVSKKGKVIYHISYGYEHCMPLDIVEQVTGTYPGYEISRVIKIKQANRTVWVINLQDKNEFIMLKLENDEMEEIQRFKKSL
jgi:hypothetical protein